MKRWVTILAMALLGASAAWATAPGTLTTLREVRALDNAGASRKLPVAFEGTVTVYLGGFSIFVEDEGENIFVLTKVIANLVPGDRILVRGTTQNSFRPIVIGTELVLLRHGVLPSAVPATYDELIRGQLDCRLVTVHGVVRAADMVTKWSSHQRSLSLLLYTDGGYMDAVLQTTDAGLLNGMLDSEVSVTGVAAGKFDDKMQQVGINILIPTSAQVKVLKRATSSPWSLPVTPMDRIVSGYHVNVLTQRIRVQGTITYYLPGSMLFLQSGSKSLRIMTQSDLPLRIGDLADATGIPDIQDGFLTLAGGEIQDDRIYAPIAPQLVSWQQLANGLHGSNSPDGHHHDLVSIEGQVVMAARGGSEDEYILLSEGHLFSAVLRHPILSSQLPLSAMKQIAVGSRARVTGICMPTSSDGTSGPVPFDILLRSFDDIEVVANPSLINTRNLLVTLSLLLLLVFAVGGWGWTLRSKVGQQTATLACLVKFEHQRSLILEKINGSEPLNEILSELTTMVSLMLDGAHCRCEIAGGDIEDDLPAESGETRVVRLPIIGRGGSMLGNFVAGLDPLASRSAESMEALTMGVRIASLAIETRRLFSELRRRSEFDLLTDIPNRFSMEKALITKIEGTKANNASFGLIYIDLDKFKMINDRFGHHVGDIFLQEVVLRMNKQLLGGDMLARLGGDEFAALVSLQHGRSDLEKIVARLESSFIEPFAIEGHLLQGEASFGYALYSEDGVTKDSLLNAADAAMYTAKNAKKQRERDEAAVPPSKS